MYDDNYSCARTTQESDLQLRCWEVLLKYLSHPLAPVRQQAYNVVLQVIKVIADSVLSGKRVRFERGRAGVQYYRLAYTPASRGKNRDLFNEISSQSPMLLWCLSHQSLTNCCWGMYDICYILFWFIYRRVSLFFYRHVTNVERNRSDICMVQQCWYTLGLSSNKNL